MAKKVKETPEMEIENKSIDNWTVEVKKKTLKVVAKYNNGSFDKGVEYEITQKVFNAYKGLFEIKE